MTFKKTILIFGGNGFIGTETVEYLLNHFNDDYDLVLINRGNWDWDNKDRIKSRVKANLICDRKKDPLDEILRDYICQKSFKFHAIIDFSGYKPIYIHNVFKHIPHDMINLYIYISTDSVYEVCDTSSIDHTTQLTQEKDAKRPKSQEEIERLKEFDDYGHEKLECEEALSYYHDKYKTFRYFIIRLPDVLGPRDSTNRFWFYQMWLEFIYYLKSIGKDMEIPIPSAFFNKKTSYVYVKDISRVVSRLLNTTSDSEIFNFGFDQSLTLIELLKTIASFMYDDNFEKSLHFTKDDKCGISHGFPSITKGPIDVSKVKAVLNFEFSHVTDALMETVEFYKNAASLFPDERKKILKDLRKEVIEDEFEDDFNNFILFLKNKSLRK